MIYPEKSVAKRKERLELNDKPTKNNRGVGKTFIMNALMLSCTQIILRGISVSFNAYVNRKIGAESMGLFTLVMSIYGFAVTLALSCVNLGAVRLTSEKCAKLHAEGADKDSRRSSMRGLTLKICAYSLVFSLTTAVLLFTLAIPCAKYLLGDMRTVSSLRVLALSLPAISLSSGISGIFTGLRKVSKNAAASVSEQFVKIIVISTALYLVSPGNVESACLAVVGGSAVSEAWSLCVNLVMFLFDSKKPKGEEYGEKSVKVDTKFREVSDISFTAAVGAYARQGLTTLEHLAIPAGLKKSGLSGSEALSSYGLLQGIAFPLVMFPYAVIGAFTSLLIPEIAERNELGDREGITRLTNRVYKYSALFSICACGIFVNYASELGEIVYDSNEATVYTIALGLLVPFMYLDTAVDSLLKGLNEQVYNMKVNIIDAAAGLILVVLLTPVWGIKGYIITVWLCEVGNLAASLWRLAHVTKVKVSGAVRFYVKPVLAFGVMTIVKNTLMKFMPSVLSMVVFAGLYTAVLVITDNIKLSEMKIKLKSSVKSVVK